MTTETVATTSYHRPDVAVKLEILRSHQGYSEAKAASLNGKTMTLAVIRCGELQVVEGKLVQSGYGPYASFFPKGHRIADETWDVRGVIGHAAGYGHTEMMTRNALREFEAITTESIRFYLTARELQAQEIAARQAAEAIAQTCRSVQTDQAERQEADARILALLEPTSAHALAA